MASRLHGTPPFSYLHSSFPPSRTRPPPRLLQPFLPRSRRASAVLLIPIAATVPRSVTTRTWRRPFYVSCAVVDRNDDDERTGTGEEVEGWASLIPRGFGIGPERILKVISGATSSPICQFIDSPRTFLHSIDPRIKLVWLLALVVLPARSHIFMRLGLVLYLTILSICVLPTRIWMMTSLKLNHLISTPIFPTISNVVKSFELCLNLTVLWQATPIFLDQLGRVALLSGILFVMLGFGSDAAPSLTQLRTPPPSITGLPNIPTSLGGYSYVIMKLGPLQFTKKGLSVASTSSCLSFTIFQSANLCLTTTTPEQLASALRWFMAPLALTGVPISEIILTLLLSLRFIGLVFDEVRNTALGILARRICWQQLTLMETLDVFFLYIRRIFKNIFSHAEQISKAMIARGFRGDCDSHNVYLFSDSSLGFVDFLSILCLLSLIGAAVLSEKLLI